MRAASSAGLRPIHLAAVIGLALVASVAATASAAPNFRATAAMTPRVQYLNDTTGTVFSFTVFNAGDTSIAAVEIARPSPSWVVRSCPRAPAGWTAERNVWSCRYRSRATAADDIPGHSSNSSFRLRATVQAGSGDLVGRWRVVVSRARSFGLARDVRSAPPLAPGLRMVAHSFQVLDAVVVSSPLAVGSACPAPTAANHSAVTGSTGHTIAICGRNRTNAPRTPLAAHSSLGGTFIASHGGFTSARIRANSGNVVLGNWANVSITSSSGASKTVIAKIGSNPVRTSPVTTLTGYTATNEAPVAAAGSATTNEDTASGAITLSAADPNGDSMTFTIVSGPAHGSLGPITPAACPSTAPAAHTCTATVIYTPAANYNGPDSFTYRATDSFGAPSAAATVSLTVNAVNDNPVVNPATFTIPENSANGTAVGTVTASDVDSGQTRTFSITAGNTSGAFAINGTSGAITVANSAALDFETTPTFSLTVRATDNGSPVAFGQATVTVNLTGVNDAPVITTSGGSTAYTENGATLAIDAGLTAADVDDTNLESGQVRISAGLQTGDSLTFTNQLGISGSYNAGTGVLTLTGTSSVPNYQTALRSVGFSSTNDNPTGTKTIAFRVNDGSLNSTEATKGIAVTAVNDAPTLDPIADPAAILEDAAQQTVNLTGITAGGGESQTLIVTASSDNTGLIPHPTVSYTSPNTAGALAYTPVADQSGTAVITVTVQDDGGTASGGVNTSSRTFTVTVTTVNDAPVVTTDGESTDATEGSAAVVIEGSLTVTDADDANIDSGRVRISAGFQSGDDLVFVNQLGISGSYNSGTGVLTLTGTASVADYQTALRSVAFRTTNDNPEPSKIVGFKVNDGSVDSNEATKNVAVAPVNDGPTITAPATVAAELDTNEALTGISLADPDAGSNDVTFTLSATEGVLRFDTTVAGGIEAGDILTNNTYSVTVTASIGKINTTLGATDGLVYDPDADFVGTTDTVALSVNDNGHTGSGGPLADNESITIDFNEAPVADDQTVSTNEDTAVTITLTATDAESDPLTWTVLTLPTDGTLYDGTTTGDPQITTVPSTLTADKVTYLPALNSVISRSFTVKANDSQADSNTATVTVDVTAVNDAPTLDPIADPAAILEDAGQQTVNLTGISAGGSGEAAQVLQVTATSDNTALIPNPTVTYAGGATGSLAYTPVANQSGTAVVTVTVQDDGGTANGGDDETTRTFTVTVTAVNDAPTLDPIADPGAILEDAGQQTVNLTGISAGGGETQTLTVTAVSDNTGLVPNPTVTYTSPNATGSLAYTPVANQSGSAVITVTVTDDGGTANGGDNDFSRTFTVDVTAVNDAPTLDPIADPAAILEDAGQQTVNLTGISAGGSGEAAQVLQVTATSDNTALIPNPTVTYAGGATGSLAYTPVANQSGTAVITVTVQDDGGTANGGDDETTRTFTVTVTAVNDAPTVTTSAGDTAYTENAAAVVIDGALTVTDVDDTNIESGVVRISSGFEAGDDLVFVNQSGISGSYNTSTSVLTLTGTASKADYQAALRSITYRNLTDDTPILSKTVAFKVNDGDADSSEATKGIAVTAVNDGPLVADKAHDVTGNVDISVPAGSGLLIGVTDPEGDGGFVASVDASSAHLGDTVVNADGSYTFNPRAGRQGIDTVVFRVCDDGTPSACSTADLDLTVADMIWFVNNSEVSAGDGRISSPFNTLGDLANINDGVDTASSFHPAAGDTIFIYRDVATDYTGGLTLLASQKLVGAGATASVSTISSITLAADSVATLPATGGIRPNVLGGLVLGSGNTIRGLNLGDATTSLSGTSFATLTLASGLNADLAINTNGRAISLTTGTVAGDLISVTSSGGANNVVLTSVASTGTSLGTGALSAATGDSFAINGGTGSFSYSGSITGSVANSVDISNKTGGTVTLSGAIADSGAGIRLVSNTGATIAFSGGITVSSGANAAFTATGGGTVTVTGASNSLATTTGTALNVANTTIGASGLTFRSVAANGAPNGIVLNSTGSSGGLTITGTGTAGTGGTIQNIAGSGNGIALTSTRDVSLSWMNIQNTPGGSGISGTGVTNFSFVNGTINNSGDGGSESSIAFNASPTGNNVAGTLTITDSTLTNAYYSGVDIQSGEGTISNANISDNTITSTTSTATSKGFGISIVGIGSASTSFNLTKATIDDNTITNFPSAAGIQVSVGNSDPTGPGATAGIPGSGTDIVAITGNSVHGSSALAPMGTHGIAVVNSGGNSTSRTRTNFTISGSNDILHVAGTAILIGNNGYSTMTGDVTGNTIVANHTPNFLGANGIGGGNGVAGAGNAWTPDLTLTVSNNTITNTDGNGILLVGRGTSGIARFKIQNNTVAAPINALGSARQGIRVDAGNAASADDNVCVNISGNTSAGSNLALGIGLRKQGTIAGTNDFGINGLSPSPATGLQAAAHVILQNPLGGGVDIVSGDNFVSCSLP